MDRIIFFVDPLTQNVGLNTISLRQTGYRILNFKEDEIGNVDRIIIYVDPLTQNVALNTLSLRQTGYRILKFKEDEIENVYKITAAVMHAGNCTFVQRGEQAEPKDENVRTTLFSFFKQCIILQV